MNQFINHCYQKLQDLEKLISIATNDINTAPSGTLQITYKGNSIQYYQQYNDLDNPSISNLKEANDSNIKKHICRKYIKKSNITYIQQLVQKEYAKKILCMAMRDRDIILNTLSINLSDDYYKVINSIKPYKREFITPYLLDDDTFISKWKDNIIQQKMKNANHVMNLPDESNAIITENGELVRSKSEKILADKLLIMGIPYIYEVPIYLKGYGYVVPDFKVLNIRTRKSYYWEHFGMMDNADYLRKNLAKMDFYQKNGIFQGKDIIYTFESSVHPINSKSIESLINEFLK